MLRQVPKRKREHRAYDSYREEPQWHLRHWGKIGSGLRLADVNRREIVTPDRRQILTPYSRCLKRQESFPVSMISQ